MRQLAAAGGIACALEAIDLREVGAAD